MSAVRATSTATNNPAHQLCCCNFQLLHLRTLSPKVRHSERSSMMCASTTSPHPCKVGGVQQLPRRLCTWKVQASTLQMMSPAAWSSTNSERLQSGHIRAILGPAMSMWSTCRSCPLSVHVLSAQLLGVQYNTRGLCSHQLTTNTKYLMQGGHNVAYSLWAQRARQAGLHVRPMYSMQDTDNTSSFMLQPCATSCIVCDKLCTSAPAIKRAHYPSHPKAHPKALRAPLQHEVQQFSRQRSILLCFFTITATVVGNDPSREGCAVHLPANPP